MHSQNKAQSVQQRIQALYSISLQRTYDVHKRKLSQIQQRKSSTQADNYSILQQFKRNQQIFQRKHEIQKWEHVYQENEKLLNKINQATSQFKRSVSRQSIQSNRSSQSNRSIKLKEESIKRIKENAYLKSRIVSVKSKLHRYPNDQCSRSVNKGEQQCEVKETKCFQVSQINQVKMLSFQVITQPTRIRHQSLSPIEKSSNSRQEAVSSNREAKQRNKLQLPKVNRPIINQYSIVKQPHKQSTYEKQQQTN